MSGEAGGGYRYPDSEDDYGLAADFIAICRVDWVVSKSWNRLHAVTEWTGEHRICMAEEWGVSVPVRLACGRMAASAWIPGMFTRMGAERCKGCCRATGMPAGKGSPKNDDACRALLGLPAESGERSGQRGRQGDERATLPPLP